MESRMNNTNNEPKESVEIQFSQFKDRMKVLLNRFKEVLKPLQTTSRNLYRKEASRETSWSRVIHNPTKEYEIVSAAEKREKTQFDQLYIKFLLDIVSFLNQNNELRWSKRVNKAKDSIDFKVDEHVRDYELDLGNGLTVDYSWKYTQGQYSIGNLDIESVQDYDVSIFHKDNAPEGNWPFNSLELAHQIFKDGHQERHVFIGNEYTDAIIPEDIRRQAGEDIEHLGVVLRKKYPV